MKPLTALVLPSLVCFLSLTVSPAIGKDPATSPEQDYLNGGYYLLHNLCDDEAQLPILLDLKTAPPELAQFADKISRTAKESMALLEHMRASDSQMEWDRNPLPAFEQDVRASIKDEKQHQLLFGSKDKEFARALLVSQAEASKYAANIAKVLAQRDKDPDHVRDFQRLSAKWHAIYDEAFRLLRDY
jgi:hypothetical protein